MGRKIAIIAALLAVIAGGYLMWRAARGEEGVRVVASERVQRGPVRQVLEQTGIVKSQVGAIVKIGARATGTIEQMLVKVGDRVAKGQLVARIDSREVRSELAEAEARLRADRTELARIEQVYPLSIAEAEAELALAEAQAEYLQSNYRRLAQLAEQQVISRDELENARQNAEVERRRVLARRAALERERKEFVEARRKARLGVQQTAAALEALKVRDSYTRIYSPIDGVVSQVTAQEGETIVAGLQVANLITVLDTARLEMWIYVDETDIGQVKAGQKVEFRVDAYPDRIFPGTIGTVYPEPEIRENIVYYKALVAVPAEQSRWLRPEMTTQVQIVVAEKVDVLRLPNAALKWVDGRQVVFVVADDDRVREVQPQLGLVGLEASEVLSGVAEGDRVATQVILGRASAAAPDAAGRGNGGGPARTGGRSGR
jgi:HlyD family secretion protein